MGQNRSLPHRDFLENSVRSLNPCESNASQEFMNVGLERLGSLLGVLGGGGGGLMGYNSGHENYGMATVGFLVGFFALFVLILIISWVVRGFGKA
jgi:hypothetical protein